MSAANAQYALRYLQTAPGELAAAASRVADKVGAAAPTSPLLSVEAMAGWTLAQFQKFEPKFASQAHDFLLANLRSKRLGESVEWRFGVKSVEVRAAATGVRPDRAVLLDVTHLTRAFADDAKAHSMHNVEAYISEWLPPFAVAELENRSAELWVAEGSREEAFSRMVADGFTHVARIECPGAFGQNELYIAEDPATRRKRYFFAEVRGDSAIATLLHVAGMSGIDARVSVVAEPGREGHELFAALAPLRPYADAKFAIIGFKNAVLRDLWERAVLAPLSGRPGLPTYLEAQGLRKTLEAECAGPNPSPEAVARLASLGDWSKLNTLSNTDDSTWDGAVVNVIDGNGRTQPLALLRTPYGDNAGAFMEVLKGFGMRDVGVIGTAGALDVDDSIGRIYVPDSVVGDEGKPKYVKNSLSNFLADGSKSGIEEGADAVTVATPLQETEAAISAMRTRGDDLVELEFAHLAEAAKGVRLSAAFVASDVPGTEKTLEKQGPGELNASVGRVVDAMLDAFDIRGIDLNPKVSPAQKPEATPPLRALLSSVADQLKLAGPAREAFLRRFEVVLAEVPSQDLDVPFEFLKARGERMYEAHAREVSHDAVAVPGLPEAAVVPVRVFPGRLSPLDELCLAIATGLKAP